MPVSDRVFDAVREDILGERLFPGDAVPSERALAERFGVNRHAVREAVKRLQQAGLVHVAQGGATRVLPWRESGGLELLADLPIPDGPQGAAIVRGILEMRESIGVDAARRCATRVPADLLAGFGALGDAVTAASPGAPREAAYRALWSAIVDGADNLAYRLALNALLAGIDAQYALMLELLADELADAEGVATLVAAIEGGDPDAAAAAARRLLGVTVRVALGRAAA